MSPRLNGRRRFLRGSLGLALAALGAPVPADALPRSLRDPRARLTRTGFAFGTRVSITVAGLPSRQARAAADAALAEIGIVERAANLHAAGSPLALLNEEGRLAQAPPHLLALMRAACAWSAASDGAFDVTVQPLWQRYFAAAARGTDPSPDDLEAALGLIGWRDIQIGEAGISFARPGMRATLNGISQGYASDRAWEVLQAHQAPLALVDAGEWRAAGATQADPWRIGVRDPRAPHLDMPALVDVVELTDGALASSGADGFWFTPAHHAHHILDPRLGRSPAELAGVTVSAPDACTADALSTACMVLGPEAGLELVAKTPSTEALFVRRDGMILTSRGWPGREQGRHPPGKA